MQTEFEFIERLKLLISRQSTVNRQPSAVCFGIGDDCAVLRKDSKTDLVVTADLLVEDVDFRLEWTRAEFLGHKALAISLSDVAAMGAKPVWAMLSIGVPENTWKTNFVEKFYKGWFRLAKKFDVALVGGDVSRTPEKVVIDSIVAGEVKKNKAVLRSGAKAGDLIFITGKLGGAAIGLDLLENGERYETSKHKTLLLRQLKPNPQTEIGRILGEKNLATAMIDLSDGLSSDLTHFCRASGVGAEIFAEKIPKFQIPNSKNSKLETRNSKSIPHSAIRIPHLNGGEDFELLFTVNPKKIFRLEKSLEKFKISHVGNITSNHGKIKVIKNNKIEILEAKGFRHF